jgi:WD repeat-containing protein 48
VDLYRGSVGTLAQDYIPLVQVVPTWLLEVVLKNSIPVKESPKVSFVLRPHHHQEGTTTAIVGNAAVGGELGGLLPRLGELPGGNARLTAPRMLRIRKVLAHVVEKLALVPPKRRIEIAPAATTAQQPASESESNTTTGAHENGQSDSNGRILEPVQEEDDGPRNDKDTSGAATTAEGDAQASQASAKTKEQEEEEEAMRQDSLRPENWLEILCHEQVLSPTMTLATVRTHYWKTGSDVVLSYRYKQRGAGASAAASHPATLSPSAAASFSSSS